MTEAAIITRSGITAGFADLDFAIANPRQFALKLYS
jgi:hypothetical protein